MAMEYGSFWGRSKDIQLGRRWASTSNLLLVLGTRAQPPGQGDRGTEIRTTLFRLVVRLVRLYSIKNSLRLRNIAVPHGIADHLFFWLAVHSVKRTPPSRGTLFLISRLTARLTFRCLPIPSLSLSFPKSTRGALVVDAFPKTFSRRLMTLVAAPQDSRVNQQQSRRLGGSSVVVSGSL